MLEAKRLGHQAVLRLSWLLLVASVALSTLLQIAVAPPTLVGYLTAGATPVWRLGSFAVLSLLYRAEVSADHRPAWDQLISTWAALRGPTPGTSSSQGAIAPTRVVSSAWSWSASTWRDRMRWAVARSARTVAWCSSDLVGRGRRRAQ